MNLKLIDCETRAIVPASDHIYVTLSYLWGKGPHDPQTSDRLPIHVPLTIEDALSVTRQLGFRYLWIDRYCINQQKKDETYAQLQSMGSIYRNSHLTIIAVAGEDPSYGLPGVSHRHRRQSAGTTIGAHHLRTVHETGRKILTSEWASRGWTYQEGLLATRRLAFTDEEVYFECHGMCCQESLNLPYEEMHAPENQRLRSEYIARGPNSVGVEIKIGIFESEQDNAMDIYHHINQFSQRKFSYESDRLKAFLGILEAFSTSKDDFRHHWGIPMFSNLQSDVPSLTSFIGGLNWHSMGYEDKRIPNLPSWSWVGWAGQVSYPPALSYDEMILLSDVDVRLELLGCETVSWNAYLSEYATPNISRPGHYIHISAWSIPIHFTRAFSNYYTAPMDDGSTFKFKPWISSTLDLHQCYALLLGKEQSGNLFLIIVDAMEEDTWRRVGGFEIGGNSRQECELVELNGDTISIDDEFSTEQLDGRFGIEWWRYFAGLEKKTFRLD